MNVDKNLCHAKVEKYLFIRSKSKYINKMADPEGGSEGATIPVFSRLIRMKLRQQNKKKLLIKFL